VGRSRQYQTSEERSFQVLVVYPGPADEDGQLFVIGRLPDASADLHDGEVLCRPDSPARFRIVRKFFPKGGSYADNYPLGFRVLLIEPIALFDPPEPAELLKVSLPGGVA
jgi:hypothetical protein